ncbi:MAG TPA: SO_0444 family Cu/Zn efflux transporter [Desulfuromonadales bacterium]
MTDAILGILTECWKILLESSPYMLFGFFAAGLLKAVLPEEAVARHLGRSSAGAVLKASLFGLPIPLCSCGVIPAAVGLRKQGASKGAAAAFLVSTPESGVDSIAITWALLDPVMTVVRPLSAFLTATVTGLLINRLPEAPAPVVPVEAPTDGCGCTGGSCGGPTAPAKPPLGQRLRNGISYAFGELLADIGRWLLLGILVAGVLAWWLPDDFFVRHLGGEFSSLLIMLVVGIPLYICASASTPVAAAMVLKGLSPGAALVFLLAGPATNAATITVVTRFWGRRDTVVYLAAIAGCSLFFGWLLNRFYAWSGIDISRWVTHFQHEDPSIWTVSAAVVLLGLIIRQNLKEISGKKNGCCGE